MMISETSVLLRKYKKKILDKKKYPLKQLSNSFHSWTVFNLYRYDQNTKDPDASPNLQIWA